MCAPNASEVLRSWGDFARNARRRLAAVEPGIAKLRMRLSVQQEMRVPLAVPTAHMNVPMLVDPSPATQRPCFDGLKGGRKACFIFSDICFLTKTVFVALRGAQPLFHALFDVKAA